MPDRLEPLALTALKYAAGELDAAQVAAFEDRLEYDQPAREALAEAIRLSAAALGRDEPRPDPLGRQVVQDALHPTLWSRLFPRRPYRGHPLAWTGLGGAAVVALVGVGLWLSESPTPQPMGNAVTTVTEDHAKEVTPTPRHVPVIAERIPETPGEPAIAVEQPVEEERHPEPRKTAVVEADEPRPSTRPGEQKAGVGRD